MFSFNYTFSLLGGGRHACGVTSFAMAISKSHTSMLLSTMLLKLKIQSYVTGIVTTIVLATEPSGCRGY